MRRIPFLLFLLLSLSFAEEGLSPALTLTCVLFNNILPIVVMIGITLSGVAYGLGHLFGAELRARANVWATNLLIGSLIAGVVTLIAPAFVNALTGFDLSDCYKAGGGFVCPSGFYKCPTTSDVISSSGYICCSNDESCAVLDSGEPICYSCSDDTTLCLGENSYDCCTKKQTCSNGVCIDTSVNPG